MLADINKAAELTSKINSYSHDAKVVYYCKNKSVSTNWT